ncbi:fumarate hydratase [Sedimentisphaera salicampi]|uniref:fumarate hydratase n=1 Tax=Sedimentisphaera salicampi TaxID=1941349 RepID=UPI000B9BEA6E|nr:fumarate hydratase [Sedimentisphaera salicampi]OXU14284.1 L(+)-tartrate dehydratase subunit alpha [Sedimentisphaera salicampi]
MSRRVQYSRIVQAVRQLCIDSCYELGEDVLEALREAEKSETAPAAKGVLNQLLQNAEIASNERIPICQDTGLAVFFVELGADVRIEPPGDNPQATLEDAINEGVQLGYTEGLLRKSVVAEPLFSRENTTDNTPAIIHYSHTSGDKLEISVITKGGGCENKSRFKMFNPTASADEISHWICRITQEAGANACPPFVIGVGIGGDFELSAILSKKALLRSLKDKNPNENYARLEDDILEKINQTNVGPQGFGGRTTALGVKIEYAPCHIASLPVSVNIECHAHRHKMTNL